MVSQVGNQLREPQLAGPKCGLTPTNTRTTGVRKGIQSYYLLHLGELNLCKLRLSELVSDLGNHVNRRLSRSERGIAA
jgi:hypothetical protein